MRTCTTHAAFYATEAETLMNVSRLGIQTVAGNASAEAAQMYIRQPALTLPNLQNTLYDQIEASKNGGDVCRRLMPATPSPPPPPAGVKNHRAFRAAACCRRVFTTPPAGVHPVGRHGHLLAPPGRRDV